jgi:hypothetical protein
MTMYIYCVWSTQIHLYRKWQCTYIVYEVHKYIYIENDNVHILCICWHCFQYYPTKLFSDKPTTPTIIFNKYPFVGDEIKFTCTSQVQRWPVELSSSLTYTFSIDGAQQHNTLKINVTISDKENRFTALSWMTVEMCQTSAML